MNDIRDDLKAYLDGELPGARASEVAAALAADPLLQKDAELLGAIGEGIRGLAAEPNVQGFERALAAVTLRRSPWRTVLGIATAVGATVIIGAIIFPVFAQSKESEKRVAAGDSARMKSEGSSFGYRNGMKEGWESDAAAAAPEEAMGGSGASTGVTTSGSPGSEAFGLHVPPTTLPAMKRSGQVASSSDGDAEVPQQPMTTNARLVIQNADIALRVNDAARAQAQATALAKGLGGFVESSSVSSYQQGLPVAEVTLRIPAKNFVVALERLRSIEGSAEVLNESLNGDDVTAQVADVEARLKVLKGEEDQYLEILKATTKIGDVLAVKERLSMVRQQIESYDAQRKVLRDQASLSTIHAMFEQREKIGEPEQPKNWADDTWTKSVNALQAVGTALAQAGIFLFVFSPFWIPTTLLVWWLVRRSRA